MLQDFTTQLKLVTSAAWEEEGGEFYGKVVMTERQNVHLYDKDGTQLERVLYAGDPSDRSLIWNLEKHVRKFGIMPYLYSKNSDEFADKGDGKEHTKLKTEEVQQMLDMVKSFYKALGADYENQNYAEQYFYLKLEQMEFYLTDLLKHANEGIIDFGSLPSSQFGIHRFSDSEMSDYMDQLSPKIMTTRLMDTQSVRHGCPPCFTTQGM